MTDISFSTAAHHDREKFDAWRSALSTAFGPIEVGLNTEGEFSGAMHVVRRGPLQFNEIRYCAQTLERTSRNIAHFDQEYFTLSRPVSGPLLFEQHGRQFVVEPGCLVLLNQTSPYRATTDAGYHAYSISIPRRLLEQRKPHLGSFYKLDLKDGSPRVQLLSRFAQSMADGVKDWSDTEMLSLREQLLDLIALMMIDPQKHQVLADESSVKAAHRERALAYIRHNYGNADLNPAMIAAACGVSVNYLHKVFQASNLQLESVLYATRIEKCKQLLIDPACRHMTVQQIAYRAGFSHPSHFSRVFRKSVGMSPTEFRCAQTSRSQST